MISPEEKKTVIEDMIKMSYQKIEPLELQRQLHAFLLRDTNGVNYISIGRLIKMAILSRIFKKEHCIVQKLMHLMIHLTARLV